ncbi:chalcone isomerase family protein [Aquimarina hainanensis]|uniref:Chalcone isomerase family protein n=1 Tax=Aquimarina hainanensis TaxID=1578017 RepID=A0ABW5N7H1_9FLAO|nr:chalcone isomerase family protein [Aquimarina sp. TRL1]QKX05307.1 DUF2147 domain-containing protein [Aquimarina sp. TRL1]
MKRIGFCFVLLISVFSFAQTRVGEVQFNNSDVFEEEELMLNGAGAKDKLYAIGLYLNFEVDGVDDGILVAEKNENMALTIKVLSSSLNSDKLKEVLRNGLERATDGNSYLLEDQIRKFFTYIPKEVNKHDILKITFKKDKGLTVYRNMESLGTLNNLDFKKAFFKIWLGENPTDEELKEDLLGSLQTNPVLGRWKVYDKRTGVATSIVQIYVIKNSVFGVIERMLRQSERDAVCYECKGDDKNKQVEGLVVLKRLRPKGENKYAGGKFTNIKNGEVSDCQIWVDEDEEDILNVRYKGSGGTHKWKRIKK